MENQNCDLENLAFDGTQPSVYNRRFSCVRNMPLPQKVAWNLKSVNSILAVALYAGNLATNILQRVSDEHGQPECGGQDLVKVVVLNELRNVRSCIDDAVFALEEIAHTVHDVDITINDVAITINDVSHTFAISENDFGKLIFDETSNAVDDTFLKGVAASLETENSVDLRCLINECILMCEHLLAYLRTLQKSPFISDVSISTPISSSVCDRSISIPIGDGSACGRSVSPSISSSVCDRSISIPISDGSDSVHSSSVVMETLKYGMKALESALASLRGIVCECDLDMLF